MIQKFIFGKRSGTFSVVKKVEESRGEFELGTFKSKWPFDWSYQMDPQDMVFGLGETMRGINKRGFIYKSFCSDCPGQTESTSSMYGAHNFLIVFGKKTFGLFFDTASEITFDIDYTESGLLKVTSSDTGIDLYFIQAEADCYTKNISEIADICRQFRSLTGQSYIPPKWAFGYQQSRWGYKTEADVRNLAKRFKQEDFPISAICLDIDYMDEYKDFTVDKEKFPDIKKLAEDMKEEGIHLVPIIDAGVKIKEGYDVYEEGCKKDFFCKKEDGSFYTAGVWPGRSHFTDFFRKDARDWFGQKYQELTKAGIDGFWNDMNEPAMFYSDESLKEAFEKIETYRGKNLDIQSFFEFTPISGSTFNQREDYQRFYNQVEEEDGSISCIRHDKVHNSYGGLMTRAASEALQKISPDKRMLLYSRASCIGAHRYGGIWTGDNASVWFHLLQEIKMLPGLNMCGFLYSGADIGGFGDNTTQDLLLRWLALGCFTPLMRNHCAWNGRNQEPFAFNSHKAFKSILDLRYALLPYIYSEFVKAALTDSCYLRPLAFDFAKDKRACNCEDQLLLGEGIMIAPVYTQNAIGRYVYLPEDMTQLTWKNDCAECKDLKAGDHFVEVPLDTVVFFIRKDKAIVMKEKDNLKLYGSGERYSLYDDDGFSRKISLDNLVEIKK